MKYETPNHAGTVRKTQKGTKFVGDGKAIIGLIGLRCVVKKDTTYAGNGMRYMIEWSYKGETRSVSYLHEADRNAMYEMVSSALLGGDDDECQSEKRE